MSRAMLNESLATCKRHLRSTITIATTLQGDKKLHKYFLNGVIGELREQLNDLDSFTLPTPTDDEPNDQTSSTTDLSVAPDICSLIQWRVYDISKQLQKVKAADSLTPVERDHIQGLIQELVDHIRVNIVSLDGFLALLKKGALKRDFAIFRKRQENLSQFFEKKIQTLRPEERRKSFSYEARKIELQFISIDWFWEVFPRPQEFPNGVGPSDNGDGAIILPYQIEETRRRLSMFVDAWYAVNNKDTNCYPTDTDRLNMIRNMPEIVAILHCINRHDLFNKFVENEIDDQRMGGGKFGLQELEALRNDASYIRVQYRRLKEPEWGPGEHLKLEPREPLPLRNAGAVFKQVPGAMVNVVVDAWNPQNKYARKVIWINRASAGQRAQLETEIHCLRELGKQKHGHHIVECVKTYERGNDELGLLLQPLAKWDLAMFLEKLCSEPDRRPGNRTTLIRACGCITYSMCYLHNVVKIRHRDVKPSNILGVLQTGKPIEFILADFGLAYDFSGEQVGSGTKHNDFGATEEYEAPEINHKNDSYHGRSADVFSLGCVFLEIICVLTMTPSSLAPKPRIHQYRPYKYNTTKLQTWAESKKLRLKDTDRSLYKIAELAQRMTRHHPVERPKIGEVAKELAALHYGDEPLCQSCKTKFNKDKSRSPIHPDIFTHTKKDWKRPFLLNFKM